MLNENKLDPQKMEQGKTLAKTLFGFKETDLRNLSDEKKTGITKAISFTF